jgi:hypothetical protein
MKLQFTFTRLASVFQSPISVIPKMTLQPMPSDFIVETLEIRRHRTSQAVKQNGATGGKYSRAKVTVDLCPLVVISLDSLSEWNAELQGMTLPPTILVIMA